MQHVITLLPAKLGACRRCMALSAALLAASLMTSAIIGGGPAPAVLFAALATGFFSTLGTAHAAAFALRRAYPAARPCGCR